MLQAVRVRLRKPTRVFVCIARDIGLARGDRCIARTEHGLEHGVCITEPEDCAEDMSGRYSLTIVRKATANDERVIEQIAEEEKKALALCAGKIAERRLPMFLVDAESTFDRHKIIFFFTAEDRVDFRELVRDLAHELKARIELRHIQVRDKAKIVGGFAACGRELCCATWLGDFMPISMKMAKRQNLSLNPSKISGQCGRLMCCLSYENDLYTDVKKVKRPAGAEPREKKVPFQWDTVPEEEAALLVDDDIEVAENARTPGHVVVAVNPDDSAEAIDDESGNETEANGMADDASKSKQKSRRRRRRKKPSSDTPSSENAG